ncbi:MAG: CoA transferase [Dehalococcoidia bacterium]
MGPGQPVPRVPAVRHRGAGHGGSDALDGLRAPGAAQARRGCTLADYQAGAVAALAAAMAFLRQEATGAGDHIDISIYDTQAGTRDRASPYMANHSYNGIEPQRYAAGSTLAAGARPCLDGWVNIAAGGNRRLPAFLRMIGRPELADDPRLTVPANLVERELVDDIEASYFTWLMARTKAEAVRESQEQAHALAGAINTPKDLVEDPHYRGRGAWETIDHPHTGPAEYPARPFIMSASPRPQARRAPLLGEHTAEVLREASQPAPARTAAPAGPHRLPLEGVRIVDVTVVWAGPYCTQLLADWGAEVIRVEPVTRVQPSTRGAERISTKAQQAATGAMGLAAGGSFPDYDPGEDPWNRNSGFNSHARNKLSMTADITTEEGRAAFSRLISTADVLVENNVPETIEKAHITYEELLPHNPKLIMLRMPAFGLSGPYKNYRALGTHIEGMIGHHYVRGYPEGTPDESGDVYTGDALGGIQGAFAVSMALRHRARTGEGQLIELSQAENFLPILGEQILDWTMNGHDPGPQGNRHRTHAPHQAYPTRPTHDGREAWIAIDVATDAEFGALCEVLGAPELASDARFATCEARLANLAALDAAVGALTRKFDKFFLFHRLQSRGVTAGPLLTAIERFHSPHLQARGFFEYVDQASSGWQWYPGTYWKQALTPNRIRRGPVMLGQDNDYVYRELMGYSDDEYAVLQASGHVGTTYAEGVVTRPPSA